MIWLYAVTDRPDAPAPRVRGIDAAELAVIACDDIAAVVSPCAGRQVPATEENVLAHEAVLESLMVDRTVLPARFGCVAPDEARVREALLDQRAWYLGALRRLRGRVELGIRVLWNPEPPEAPALPRRPPPPGEDRDASAPGHAYLMARLDEGRKSEALRAEARTLAQAVHRPLAELAVESSYRLLVTRRMPLAAAYLVERSEIDDFRRRAEGLALGRPDLDLICTGPWPPYSFVAYHPAEPIGETIANASP